MSASDSTVPRFLDTSKLNPPVVFTCDQHGIRKMVMQFNPPSGSQGNQIPDPTRLRCVDCLEEVIPARVRSVE